MLNLRYHDENAADLEQTVYQLCYPKEGDDTCHLILGPYRSAKAEMILANAAKRRVPVMMPEVTSDEIQRIMDGKPYAWFMTESDVTACEAIMNLCTSYKLRHGALFYSDDRYGNSFRNWFGYMATEFNINVNPQFIRSYKPGQDLTDVFEQIEKACEDDQQPYMVLLAVSDDADYVFVAYGTSARICMKSMELARAKGLKVGLLRPITLFPFPTKQVAELATRVKGMLCVEMSAGQMIEDVKLAADCKIPIEHYGRFGGIIPTPEEVLEAMENKIVK